MKVSIFTSCYNQCQFLPECIESVLSQTHRDIEYIIIDDGSNDETATIIREYSCRDDRILPIYLSKYPNIASVLNLSISVMHSDIWIWVPSDDIIMPDLVVKKITLLTDNNIVLAWGKTINECGSEQGQITFDWLSSDEFRHRIWKECFIGMTGVMIPRSVLYKVGGFPEHLDFSEDFYWILKSTKMGVDYSYVPEFLYKKRHHSNRLTDKNHSSIIKGIPVIKEEINSWYKNQMY